MYLAVVTLRCSHHALTTYNISMLLPNVKWQQKIKDKEIMKRMGTNINIVQRIIQRKLNFFGHICKMRDDRLQKQVLVDKTDGKIKEEDPKGDGQTTWWTGARKTLAPYTESRRTKPSGTNL